MDISIVSTDPTTTYERVCKTYEPTITVIIRCSCLSTHLTSHIIFISDSSASTFINDSLQQHQHFISAFFTDDFIHPRSKLCQRLTFTIYNSSDHHRGTTNTMINEGCISTHHFCNADVTWSQTQ